MKPKKEKTNKEPDYSWYYNLVPPIRLPKWYYKMYKWVSYIFGTIFILGMIIVFVIYTSDHGFNLGIFALSILLILISVCKIGFAKEDSITLEEEGEANYQKHKRIREQNRLKAKSKK